MDGSLIEWPINTVRAMVSLIVSGTARRYPRVRFIFAHGGVMPLLVKRVGGLANWTAVGDEGLKRLFPDGVEAAFAGFLSNARKLVYGKRGTRGAVHN